MAKKSTIVANLKGKDWLSPDGVLYEVRHNPHEFPAEWADKPDKEAKNSKYAVLPSSTEILGEDGEFTTVEVWRKSADGTGILTPEAVPNTVKSVGNTVDETTKSVDDHGKVHQSTPLSKAGAAAKESGAELGGRPGAQK